MVLPVLPTAGALTLLTCRSARSRSVTCSETLPLLKPAAAAIRVAFWVPSWRLSCTALTAKLTERWPTGITTLVCTVASLVSVELSSTVSAVSVGVLRVSVAMAAPAPADSASTLLSMVSDSVGPSSSVINRLLTMRVPGSAAPVNWSGTAAPICAVWSPSASVFCEIPMSKSTVAAPAAKVTNLATLTRPEVPDKATVIGLSLTMERVTVPCTEVAPAPSLTTLLDRSSVSVGMSLSRTRKRSPPPTKPAAAADKSTLRSPSGTVSSTGVTVKVMLDWPAANATVSGAVSL